MFFFTSMFLLNFISDKFSAFSHLILLLCIDSEVKDILSDWVMFFREPDSLDSSDIENNGLEKAMNILEYISQDEKEKQIARAYSDFQDDNERDKEILIKEGEMNKAKEMARNMLKEGGFLNNYRVK